MEDGDDAQTSEQVGEGEALGCGCSLPLHGRDTSTCAVAFRN